jgi:hypothetical protein
MRQPHQPVGEDHPATIARNLRESRKRTAQREELLRTQEALEARYGEILARESIKNPLVWGRYATRTKDEQDRENPYKPFPDWEYFEYLLPIFQNEGIIFLKKSRTVMMSWFVTLIVTHEMLTRRATGVVIQSRDEDRAVHDIDYAKELYTNSIPQLKDRWPVTGPLHKQSYNRFELANGSWAIGISGDPKKINSEHPSIVVLDEAALMERGADSCASALATNARLVIALSSAEPGWFEDYLRGAVPQDWPQYSLDSVEEFRRTKKTLFPADFEANDSPLKTFRHDPLTWSPSRSHESFQSGPQSPSAAMAATKDYSPEMGRRTTTYSFRAGKAAWKPAAGISIPTPGMQFSRTRSGVAVVHVHYTARPDMQDERVVEKLRWKYPSLSYWEKEMEMRSHALSGALVYPDFDPQIHMIRPERIPRVGCRFFGADPHPRTPHAFLWALVDRWNDIYIYRELWPSRIYGQDGKVRDDEADNVYTIKEYTETVAHLEGNYIEWHNAEKDTEYGIYRQKPTGERIIERYMDQAGKAFNARGESEKAESYWERYERFGLYCQDPNKRHSAGEDAVRELLKPRKHDTHGIWPRLHISTECKELEIELMNHKYRSTTRLNDERELKQRAAEARCHLVDILRYLATAEIGFYKGQES